MCMCCQDVSSGQGGRSARWHGCRSTSACACAARMSAVTRGPAQRAGMGAGVVVGLLALGEGMPATLGLQALRLASWLCITAGVSMLAGGRGAYQSPLWCLHRGRVSILAGGRGAL